MSAEALGWVWKHSPLTGAQLLVHVAIGDIVNDAHDNELWMSTAKLAKKCRVSRNTVTTVLGELVRLGNLEVLEAGATQRKPTRYRFMLTSAPTAHVVWSSQSADTLTNRASTSALGDATSAIHGHPLARPARAIPKEITQVTQEEPKAPAAREADHLWEALLHACGIDNAITNGARAGYNKALKELRDAGATPEDICTRARNHRTMWPQASLTPHSLAKHWAELRALPAREDEAMASIRRIREREGRA